MPQQPTLTSNTDWDSVTVIRKSKPTGKDLKSNSVINRAMATGNAEVSRKFAAGGNKQHEGPAVSLAKLESSEELKVPTLSKDVARAIQAGRQKLGITQKDLAAKICEKPTVINDYESGKAIPSQQILGKLERALGVKLRGANIGNPLH